MPRPFFDFDTTGGVFRVIELVQAGSPAINTVTADDLMSDYVDWLLADNERMAQSPLLFVLPDTPLGAAGLYEGGTTIAAGIRTGIYYFLNTADGWRIRPAEYNHNLVVVGNLYPAEEGVDPFVDTLGVFNCRVSLERSSLTQAVGLETVRKNMTNRLEVDFATQELVLYDDDGTTVLQRWDLDTEGGENVTTQTGVQTKRGAPKL